MEGGGDTGRNGFLASAWVGVKIVSPYRRMEAVTKIHQELVGKFDWIEALKMLRASANKNAKTEVFALTDHELSVPHYRYATAEQKLMLWILEVSALYLESADFDQDTIFISPDCLVFGSLDLFDGFDIGLVARREKFKDKPLLNGLQFWAVKARVRLAELFRKALQIAKTLPDKQQRWGADTLPLVQLLGPIAAGTFNRFGLRVKIFDPSILSSINGEDMCGRGRIEPRGRVVDFKARRKLHMVEYYKRAML